MLQLVAEVCNLLFYAADLLFYGLNIELGNLADRFFYQFEDIVHDDLPANHVLVLLHGIEHLLKLNLPGLLILLQDLVNAVLEEDLLKGIVVPVVLKLVQLYLQLAAQKLLGVVGAVLKYIFHAQELRLVVHNHAGVGGDGSLAVREGIKGVDCLVRGYVVGQVNQNLHLCRGHILNLLDLDFALVLGLQYGIDHLAGGLSVRNFRYGDGVLVNFLYAGANLYHAATLAVHVFGTFGEASGREVRIQFVRLTFQNGYRCVQKLVEVMGQNL